MRSPRLRAPKSTVILTVTILALSIGAAPVLSQCAVSDTMSYRTDSPTTVFVTKTLDMATSCMVTASGYGAAFCFPGSASFNTDMLYAARFGGSPAPYCYWSCGCGRGPGPHVGITAWNDDLPVELMDFGLEADDGVERE